MGILKRLLERHRRIRRERRYLKGENYFNLGLLSFDTREDMITAATNLLTAYVDKDEAEHLSNHFGRYAHRLGRGELRYKRPDIYR